MDQAEQLRNIIKSNSQNAKPLARIITVTSGKGGVGKSNTSINLAVQLKRLGKRVIILDADFGLANIEIMFGTMPKFNLSDLIYQGKNIRDIITWGPGGIGFISGGSGIAGLSNLSRDYLAYIIQNLSELDAIADVIIIDTAAGISDAVLEFLVASGEILLVTTPEPTSITDSYSLLKALNNHPKFMRESTQIRMVANRVETAEEGENLFHKLDTVVARYLRMKIQYLGSVPYDTQLSSAVMQQMPVSLQSPKSKSAHAYAEIAARLLNREQNTNQERHGMAAFLAHIVSGKKGVIYGNGFRRKDH
jgi:flagellar biosynthesis protein FlhG